MTTATATLKTIHELRKYDGLLYIANNTDQRITCHEQLGEKRVDFELGPKGDESSVMIMPKLALEVRGIQNLWRSGQISVSTDDSFEEQIELLSTRNTRGPEQRLAEIMAHSGEGHTAEVSESATAKAFVEMPCLKCGYRNPQTSAIERGRVIQRLAEVREGVPALCSVHRHLAPMYVPEQVGTDDEGHPIWKFNTVTTTEKVREKE